MILINLLPHREIAKVKRRESFYVSLAASALLGGLLAGLIFVWYQIEITEQQGRNIVLSSEIESLNTQIKAVATLEQEIADLRARQGAVEDLQAERNLPVHLLNELVKRVPDGVYLKGMKQVNSLVTLTGSAQSNERVAELLRNLSNNSPFVTKPELVEIIAGTASLGAKDQRRVSNFIVSVQLKKLSKDKESDIAVKSVNTSPNTNTTTTVNSPVKK
ncbi:MAG TPA: PilN domain-containing protein [Burkholderiaceae bacterium]|nr:PilN domain-containing protein [Burkholderiaceae bacterium]